MLLNVDESPYALRLFIAGDSEVGRAALRNLKLLVAEYLPQGSTIEVVDLHLHPEEAERNSILALPMLMRCAPLPIRKIIGDLVDRKRVLVSLGAQRQTV